MGLRNTLARMMGVEDRRAGNYTDQTIFNQYSLVAGKIDAIQTACSNAARITALTMTRGNIELSGALAEYWQPAIANDLIYQVVYDTIIDGYSVSVLDTKETARGYVQRVGSFEVRGKRKPYRYRVDIEHPDGSASRTVSESEILHLRIGSDSARPWLGRSMFADVLLKYIDKGLIDLARLPSQRIVNYPRSTGTGIDDRAATEADRQADAWGGNLRKSGLLNLVDNSTSRGQAQSIPHVDLTFSPDPQAVELRRDLIKECFQAVGYPPVLLSMDSPGQTVRQEYTRWIVGTLQPIADILSGHIAEALAVNVSWKLDAARIPLPLDQATVFRNLAREGIETERALRIAGLKG